MEGINILNQTEILTYPNWWIVVVIGTALVAAFGLSIGVTCDWDWLGIIGSISTIAFIILIFVDPPGVPTGRYKYEVLIDETVSVTELYEKYEIVGQDGKIWIIEDKKLED